jgi:hypothetical protein
MPFPPKKIKAPGETDVERRLFLGIPMSLCPEFVRKQLAVHARQQRRIVRLSDYVAVVLGLPRPQRESPYVEKGTLVEGKRQGWMKWEIPGQPASKMLAFFNDGQLQKLRYNETRCRNRLVYDSEVEQCGALRYESFWKLNGEMVASSYCEACSNRVQSDNVCWCGGCNGARPSGACWE